MSIVFGDDPIQAEIEAILAALDAGESIDDSVEREFVDLKEEQGRRDGLGAVLSGKPRSEAAAKRLFEAAACMANTPGGGALIVGVSNNGALIGAQLEVEWLRSRIWELSGNRLTVDVAETSVREVRLLVIRAPQAVEPIRVRDKIRWRVGPRCVEVDASTWHAKRLSVLNYDWSADESGVRAKDARSTALSLARQLLRDSGEAHAAELAGESDIKLLRRLNVVTAKGFLTNAGALAFVGRANPALDYVRRARAGGDSLSRIRRGGRALLEELAEVFQAVDANTPTVHVSEGLIVGQHREIPLRAAREAIVNGLAHREWVLDDPTLVEHVGGLLRVTSPGGFFGGVTAANIITHPSRSRNKALAELLAALRIAEREGVGVDRMVADMVSVGHPAPDIQEVSGPYVRVSLVGDDLDEGWIAWLRSIDPISEGEDVNSLLILRRLVDVGWVDAVRLAPLIQDSLGVAKGAIAKLSRARIRGVPVVIAVEGCPADSDAAWQLHHRARVALEVRDGKRGHIRPNPSRDALAISYASARGRISSTELGSLAYASPTNVGGVLKRLEDEGLLAPAWASRRGQGFYYKYVGDEQSSDESRGIDGTDQ